MDLRDLDLLALIAERGSLSSAAAATGLSQPSVSTRILNIEAALHTRLFERDSNGSRLTAAGERYLPYVRRVRALLDEAEQAARTSSPMVRVGIPASYASTFAPALTAAVDPHHELTIRSAHTEDLRAALLDGTLDLALVSDPATPSGLSLTPCVTTTLVALARPGTSITRETRWAVHAWSGLEHEVMSVLLERHVPATRITNVAPATAALALALANTHVAITPGLCAAHEITRGDLQLIDIGLGSTLLTLSWLHRLTAPAFIRALIKDTNENLALAPTHHAAS